MVKKIYLFGIGYKPLSYKEKDLLIKISKIFCFEKTFNLLNTSPLYSSLKDSIKSSIRVIKKVEEIFSILEKEEEEVAILTSGDPLFFGIGEKLLKHFPSEKIEIYPDLTTPQILASRLKIPFYKLKVLSFHGRSFHREIFINEILRNPYLFVYTDSKNSPTLLSKVLKEEGFTFCKIYVAERLGTKEEKIIEGFPEEFSQFLFLEPNSIIVENLRWGEETIFGIKNGEISHKGGMITKDEIRAIIIHKLEPPLKGIIWDIGAGSGSISLELAKLSSSLEIYAIEKKPDLVTLIKENLKKFYLPNVKVIEGVAPEVLKELPEPNRVFVGGSSGRLKDLIVFLENLKKLKIIVFSFVSLENLYLALDFYQKKSYSIDLSQIQINKMKPLSSYSFLTPENPIFILKICV